MFIVFEGLDGSGTSTQLTLIGDWLGCYTTSEPSNSSVGKFIRESLKTGELSPTTMALLFAADRKEHLEKEIEPRLVRGEIVICDRDCRLAEYAPKDIIGRMLVCHANVPYDCCLKRIQYGEKS